MSIHRIGRRMFLKTTSGFVLAIPMLTSLLPKKAFAGAPSPKRFISLAHEIGRKWPWWYPAAPFMPSLDQVNGSIEKPLSQLSGNISQIFGSEFYSFKNKLLMIRGLDGVWADSNANANHRPAVILAGTPYRPGSYTDPWKQCPSIDQILAKSARIYSSTPTTRILNLGAGNQVSFRYDKVGIRVADGYFQRMIPEATEENPSAVFDKYFGGMNSGQSAAIAASQRRRKLVVDLALDAYKTVRGSKQLGASEIGVLDSHMQSLFEIQSRIAAGTYANSCAIPTIKGGTYSIPVERDQMTNDFITLLAAAVKCGLTNISNLALTECEQYQVYNFIPSVSGEGLHTLSHWSQTEHDDSNLRINQWAAKKVAMLLAQLDVVEDGTTGATYLDNSLVLYTDTHTETNLHHHCDRPCLIAGGLGGRLRMGNYLDFRTQVQNGYQHANNEWRVGRDWNQLLVTILQAFGLPESEYYVPGDLIQADQVQPGFGDDAIFPAIAKVFKSDRRNPLPGVLKT